MERILKYIRNYFAKTKEYGTITIAENTINIKGKYMKGQYLLLRGSIFNDGIYKVETVVDGQITILGATNEEFEGTIYGLAIPKEIIEVEKELKILEVKYPTGIYQSETFQNYSYSVATNSEGNTMTPFDSLTPKLKPYRQIYETSLSKAKGVK